ncbi:MAG: 3-deoxy-7-phosphoheptulonate synthase, partial [Candidatus Neomarinimicrobiota bacterium]
MSSALENLKLTSIQNRVEKTTIRVGDVTIGQDFVVMAGPCAVESEEQLMQTAEAVKAAGAQMLRGGAFKPRTSPYDFQGLGLKALK